MRHILSLATLVLFTLTGQANVVRLNGTVGKYPIVMQLETGQIVSARYFYASAKTTITLAGYEQNGVVLYFLNPKNPMDTQEVFRIQPTGKTLWKGTWQNSKHTTLPVSLDIIDINNKEALAEYTEQLSQLKSGDLFAYLKGTAYAETGDSVVKQGDITLQYYKAGRTGLELFRIISGITAQAADKLNNSLLQEMASLISQHASCTSTENTNFDYSLTSVYFSRNVLSVGYNLDYYCGSAHPNAGNVYLNFDLNTGKALHLPDVLNLTENPAHTGPNYDDAVYSKAVHQLLKSYFGKKFTQDNGDCDYDTDEAWQYVTFSLDKKGIWIYPQFPHAAAACNYPEWSCLPYTKVNSYRKPWNKVVLP